ncbi:hypothetical protein N8I74_12270 [Chitiniphilus purpureus]|uniref:Uncharacterized protein n=1 Tax=Chitiniphilus purpureus TaxID=2981137 RepID=A0ABY6DIC8_9NEIS|nr:hypothetical protein [Chitiniphilus sp. CD1]UXY14094.1 hypothetical protein N8I74_12270 [Chitiniphilus sp. CD1]
MQAARKTLRLLCAICPSLGELFLVLCLIAQVVASAFDLIPFPVWAAALFVVIWVWSVLVRLLHYFLWWSFR